MRPQPFPDTHASLLARLDGAGAPAETAWRQFFEAYGPAVYRVARMRGLDDCDANDVVQQVMLAVSTHIGGFQYDRDRGRFRQWVRTIAESKIGDFRRRQRSQLGSTRTAQSASILDSHPDAQVPVDEFWEREWRLQELYWCLDRIAEEDLPPRRMQAFRMYVLDGVSAAETARRLGVTVGYIYVTRNHVLKLIRRRMRDLEQTG